MLVLTEYYFFVLTCCNNFIYLLKVFYQKTDNRSCEKLYPVFLVKLLAGQG